MALATLNGLALISASVCMPRVGAWHADLVLSADDASALPTGLLELALGPGGLVLRGTAYRTGAAYGRGGMRVVGGRGGLQQQLQPKAYQGVPLQLPLLDVLQAAGEQLSPTSDPTALNTLLLKWTRGADSAAALLGELIIQVPASPTGPAAWRVLPDGSVWVGFETWPEGASAGVVLAQEPRLGQMLVGVEAPALLPGTTFQGGRVAYVEHTVRPDRIRSRVSFQ